MAGEDAKAGGSDSRPKSPEAFGAVLQERILDGSVSKADLIGFIARISGELASTRCEVGDLRDAVEALQAYNAPAARSARSRATMKAATASARYWRDRAQSQEAPDETPPTGTSFGFFGMDLGDEVVVARIGERIDLTTLHRDGDMGAVVYMDRVRIDPPAAWRLGWAIQRLAMMGDDPGKDWDYVLNQHWAFRTVLVAEERARADAQRSEAPARSGPDSCPAGADSQNRGPEAPGVRREASPRPHRERPDE